jgi:hypothetical protein
VELQVFYVALLQVYRAVYVQVNNAVHVQVFNVASLQVLCDNDLKSIIYDCSGISKLKPWFRLSPGLAEGLINRLNAR